MRFKLVTPSICHKEEALSFIYEFDGAIVNGSGSLYKFVRDNRPYEEWLERLEEVRKRKITEETVPAVTYFLMDENEERIYGMLNIRLGFNEKILDKNGNIGYSIRPSERRKGYNKINMYLALKICNSHKLKEIMVDCEENNLGSKKTILAFDGKYQKTYYSDEYSANVEIYHIDVKRALDKNYDYYEQFIC